MSNAKVPYLPSTSKRRVLPSNVGCTCIAQFSSHSLHATFASLSSATHVHLCTGGNPDGPQSTITRKIRGLEIKRNGVWCSALRRAMLSGCHCSVSTSWQGIAGNPGVPPITREISVREHHFGIDDVVYSADSGDLELTTDKYPRGILANHHAEKPLSRTSSQT